MFYLVGLQYHDILLEKDPDVQKAIDRSPEHVKIGRYSLIRCCADNFPR